jgi:glycosyltransferase involved in cell wall biosynthesis
VRFVDSPFSERAALMSFTTAALAALRPLEISKKMRAAKATPAFACGVPVIYSGWGETAHIIERERVGVVVEPDDAEALAGAIRSLADNPAERAAMGTRARALAERELSWRFIVEDWVRQIDAVRAGADPCVPGLGAQGPSNAVEAE